MEEFYTLQQLKSLALVQGKQFVHVVTTGASQVLIVGDQNTAVYETTGGQKVTDPDVTMVFVKSVPTTFAIPWFHSQGEDR